MTDAEQIKRFAFGQVNEWFDNMIKGNYQNKAYNFTVAELKNGTLDEKLDRDDYLTWSAVYCFFDSEGKVQYIGKTKTDVGRRLRDHLKDNEKPIKDDWKIMILYGKLWSCTHEWVEGELINKMNPALNKNAQ